MEIVPMIEHVIEYAPAVAILLFLLWRNDRQMARFWDACIEHLFQDHEQEN